jgi:hypothetical protein
MRRSLGLAMAVTAPLFLALAAWQAGRFAALADTARKLEARQEEWVRQNQKLAAGIAVLANREYAATAAESMGLEKASPERRLHVRVAPGKAPSDG